MVVEIDRFLQYQQQKCSGDYQRGALSVRQRACRFDNSGSAIIAFIRN